ncbi:thiol-disulfide oxidoreductase DCC family protein [Pseudalkalibacillus sp. SCS-8]|uniref:thiol-disulfide oxidoreductase DCC family protein n=1 Tax=Pseudalkalibacillus nanhaiensis TaxID=3115291 RepID=UPI0032D9C5A3
MKDILLFDGECNLCNGIVQFVIKRDPEAHYQFAPLQSETGQALMKKHNLPDTLDSFVLIRKNSAYTRSSAALRVCRHLKGAWKVFMVFLIIPKPLRDAIYKYIARNRYKWFGKRDECMIPSPQIQDRFLT